MKWFAKLLIFLLLTSPCYAQKTLQYKTYNIKTGETLNRFDFTIENIKAQGRFVRCKIYGKDPTLGSGTEEYLLDEQYATKWWKIVHPDEDTDYVGEKRGNKIFVKGRFKGKEINRTIRIDERPFYFNPKLGLTQFVRSGKPSWEFWSLRNDILIRHLMKAENKGLEIIPVNGKDIRAVRIDWTVSGIGSMFFNRTYWFRESDGLYVKQKVSSGRVRELVSEQ